MESNQSDEIEIKPTPFDGKKGLITGHHAYSGTMATCLGAKKTLFGWAYLMLKEETGEEFYLFSPDDILWQYDF